MFKLGGAGIAIVREEGASVQVHGPGKVSLSDRREKDIPVNLERELEGHRRSTALRGVLPDQCVNPVECGPERTRREARGAIPPQQGGEVFPSGGSSRGAMEVGNQGEGLGRPDGDRAVGARQNRLAEGAQAKG